MADLENRVDRLEIKTNELDNKVNVLAQKVDDFVQEMRDFKTEMRQQNQMRTDEIRELRTSIDGIGKHVRNISIATIVGIGAISASVIGFLITTILK